MLSCTFNTIPNQHHEHIVSAESSAQDIAEHFMISINIVKEFGLKIKAYIEESDDRGALMKVCAVVSVLLDKVKDLAKEEASTEEDHEKLYSMSKTLSQKSKPLLYF